MGRDLSRRRPTGGEKRAAETPRFRGTHEQPWEIRLSPPDKPPSRVPYEGHREAGRNHSGRAMPSFFMRLRSVFG